jgi:hypothetical protein
MKKTGLFPAALALSLACSPAFSDTPAKKGVPMDPKTAEALSRQAWFDFELTEAASKHHGDWVAFHSAKQAEEDSLAKHWEKNKEEFQNLRSPIPSAGYARSLRVLHLEFETVARIQEKEIVAEARRVLIALRNGDIEALVEGSVKYDRKSPEWKQYTRKDLADRKAQLVKAAKLINAESAGFGSELEFEAPSPYRGMVGQVSVPFGPRYPRKPGSLSRPERHAIELWWSGQVMPDANGPLFSAPKSSVPVVGKWHFYDLVLPHSDPGTRGLQ